MKSKHQPVLLSEVLKIFEDNALHIFVDGTLGAGGHAAALLESHPEIELYIGIDQDPSAIDIATTTLKKWQDKTRFISGNFQAMFELVNSLGLKNVDGILLDIGVSSMQLDQPEKGFSFMRDGPLDMRMNPNATLNAADIVNTWSEQDLGHIFRDYGEEKHWRRAAATLVAEREKKPINTTFELNDVLRPVFPWKKKGVNPLTLIFQALRIAVNNELEVLENALPQAIELLSPGSRLAIITFHSLEDRIVKNAFRYAASDKMSTSGIGGLFLDKKPTLKMITKKPITPTEEEQSENPRSRSAKLRVVEKL